MPLSKIELCSRVSKRLKSRNTADLKLFLDTFIEEIFEALINDEVIEIRGFGCFQTISKKSHTGRNPRTGETVEIPDLFTPHFRFTKEAKKVFQKKIKDKTELNYFNGEKNKDPHHSHQ